MKYQTLGDREEPLKMSKFSFKYFAAIFLSKIRHTTHDLCGLTKGTKQLTQKEKHTILKVEPYRQRWVNPTAHFINKAFEKNKQHYQAQYLFLPLLSWWQTIHLFHFIFYTSWFLSRVTGLCCFISACTRRLGNSTSSHLLARIQAAIC